MSEPVVLSSRQKQLLRRCVFQLPDGRRCSKQSVAGTNLCYQHGGMSIIPGRVSHIEGRKAAVETIRYRLKDGEAARRIREMMELGAPDDAKEEVAILRAQLYGAIDSDGLDSERVQNLAKQVIEAALKVGDYEIKASKYITKAKLIAIVNQILSLTEEAIYAEVAESSEADRILTRLHQAISATFGSYAGGVDGEGGDEP